MDLTKLTQKELITLYLKCVKAINRLEDRRKVIFEGELKDIGEKQNKIKNIRDDIRRMLTTTDEDVTEFDSIIDSKVAKE